MSTPKIALGSDHAGLVLVRAIREHLSTRGLAVLDLSPPDASSVDYPTYAVRVATAVAQGDVSLGILVCGSGIGMSMAANRVPGVRAALCTHEVMARLARQHNDANVLCLGERIVGAALGLAIVDAFLAASFEGGRHGRRVEQLTALERSV